MLKLSQFNLQFALTVIGLGQLGLTPMSAAWGGMAVTLVLRLLAMRYHITLPAFAASRPPE